MAAVGTGRLVSCLQTFHVLGSRLCKPSLTQIDVNQVRCYAARKGTREKARQKKVKVDVKKVGGFIPFNLRNKDKLKVSNITRRVDDSWKSVPVDNVWISKYYKWRVYSFAEAVKCHQETHHPTVYNVPDAFLSVTFELDMRAEKKNRFLDNLTRMTSIPHPFAHGEDRSILVFCKSPEEQQSAITAGATLAGGPELVKDIQTGDLSLQDFEFIISHTSMLPELAAIRGLMKKKFPNTKLGTLGNNTDELVKRFRHGIQYTSSKDENEQDFGWIDITIGKLDMDVSHLEANLAAVVKDINSSRPKRQGPFVTRALMKCAPSIENFKLDLTPYLDETKENKSGTATKQADEEEEEEEEEADNPDFKQSVSASV